MEKYESLGANTDAVDDYRTAVIGVACRLPGASDVEELWNVLTTETDAIRRIPVERFDVDKIYDPRPGTPGRVVTRHGGFLDDIDKFDAQFFGISPQVAMRMDPQERLLMEATWEAVEDAGIPDRALAGSNTGVYATSVTADYWDILRGAGKNDLHSAVNAKPSATAAGLIAHHLDVRGPAMGLEATCASALLAVHVACRALRHGEIELAIVAGANVLLGPDQYMAMSEAEILSPTGRCRFGDAAADGYVRSEGVVAVVLKPLSRAVVDGDRIYATIRGSAAVSNGRSGGTMISPGLAGQVEMLRRAYRDAGVAPGAISYVEAHGPGTPEGDVVELTALAEVLDEGRERDRPCVVGSVKSNIGHTEAAAGLAGLLKAVLVLKNRWVPATLHVARPNPVFTELPGSIELAVRPIDLAERPAGTLLAGVSAFGLTGTNVHVVLGEAPLSAASARHHTAPLVLPLSAKCPVAMRQLAGRYADLIGSRVAAGNLTDVCYGAGARRSHLAYRLAVVGRDRNALVDGLRSVEAGYDSPSVLGRPESSAEAPQVVFVFAGQGSHREDMGRELIEEQPYFREWMRRCDEAIGAEAGWSVIERICGHAPLTDEEHIQPALWAIEVSLAALWREWGIEPDLVIGHSMGEIAAAVTSGALSLSDGAALVCRRGALLTRVQGSGAMWAVQLGEDEAVEAIADQTGQVCVAAVNSDHSTTLSGDTAALLEVVEQLRGRGIYSKQLRVNCASHAPQVEPIEADLRAALTDLRPVEPRIPMYSTVFDREVAGPELDGAYWAHNLRQPVRFASAVRAAVARRPRTLFIEISTHSVLVPAIEDVLESVAGDQVAVPSLRRDQSELDTMATGLAFAYTHGCRPRWERVYENARYVPVPGHPWLRRPYWVDTTDRPVPVAPVPAEPARPAPVPVRAGAAGGDLVRTIVMHTADVLAMPQEKIDPSAPLLDSGLDSLLAAKLGTRIEQQLGVRVPVRQLLARLSLVDLAEQLSGQLPAGQPS
ncbi:type I polyketide synthase [Actinophytocola sp.]|uniref:type I polyketide synthase n=1 Tax=Actinophytocola sp. TaxID=1872138 RepID=UPI00389ABAD0